jgi:hypothetical protein
VEKDEEDEVDDAHDVDDWEVRFRVEEHELD